MRLCTTLLSIILLICPQTTNAEPQNIVFILADDLGWNDTNIFQQSRFIETPNIDALAARGMVFSQAYTNSPLCSPTRASILTGQTPARHGSTAPNHHLPLVRLQASLPSSAATNKKSIAPETVTRLDTNLPTLSSILKTNNYNTAHFGKWHLGASPYGPMQHGFDIDIPNYAGPGPAGGFLAPWSFAPNLKPQTVGEHIDVRLATEAAKWMKKVKDDGPFFLNFWAFSVHAPFNADPETINYFVNKRTPFHSQRSATYAAMVKQFDDAVGILWEALVEAEVEQSTIVIFTSDNGGNMYDVLDSIHATSNFPLRGGKATNYDGGLRVPTAIIWPGITQPNTLSNIPIQTVDYFPTLLNGLNIAWPSLHTVDGNDIRPILKGETSSRRPIFIYFPTEPRVPDWLPPSATVTVEGWKLIRTFHYGKSESHLYQLYNLDIDPSESQNMVEAYPDKLIELDILIDTHLMESGALTPKVNPDYRLGTFNYEQIGVARDEFQLPEEKMQIDFQFELEIENQVINSGSEVKIAYQLSNASNQTSVRYEQFMGPAVELFKVDNTIMFVAPNVKQTQYVALSFIVSDGKQTIRKQAGVRIKPIQVAPELLVSKITSRAVKGSSVKLMVEAFDANKDFIHMSVKSEDLPANSLTSPPSVGEYIVYIPIDMSGDLVTLIFTADDSKASVQQTISFNVLSPETALPKSESKSAGSITLFHILFIAFILRIRGIKGSG
jgi:arylsulfatase A-like enzyme